MYLPSLIAMLEALLPIGAPMPPPPLLPPTPLMPTGIGSPPEASRC